MFIQIGTPPDHGFRQPLGLLSDCHRRIERFLAILSTTADEVGGAPLTPRHRADLVAALHYFDTALRIHTADEEESLFPRLRASSDPAAAEAFELIELLEADHRDVEERHRAVDALVRWWIAADALDATSLGTLREHLATLQEIYGEHIAVEDCQLFPAAARALSAAQIAEIAREMAARRRLTPHGGPNQ